MRQVITLSEAAAARYASVSYHASGWTGELNTGEEVRMSPGELVAVPLTDLAEELAAALERAIPPEPKPKHAGGRPKKVPHG